jgi:hypothetical protein
MQHVTGRKLGMKPGAPGLGMGVAMPARPKTAACSTKADEERIQNKLQMLEKLENNLEDIIEKYHDGTDEITKSKKELPKGKRVNKTMLLDAAMCEEVEDINMVSYIRWLSNPPILLIGDATQQRHSILR